MVQYSFLFIWQNNKKGSIWKESKLTVRKYKNIDKTIQTAVLIYFLFLSPNGKKNYFFGSTYNNMDCILIRHLLHRMHKSMFSPVMRPPAHPSVHDPVKSFHLFANQPPLPPFISHRYLNIFS